MYNHTVQGPMYLLHFQTELQATFLFAHLKPFLHSAGSHWKCREGLQISCALIGDKVGLLAHRTKDKNSLRLSWQETVRLGWQHHHPTYQGQSCLLGCNLSPISLVEHSLCQLYQPYCITTCETVPCRQVIYDIGVQFWNKVMKGIYFYLLHSWLYLSNPIPIAWRCDIVIIDTQKNFLKCS